MKKILLIEDDEDSSYLLKFLLEKAHHQVFTAITGRDGIALAEQKKPDLILLDINLPDLQGEKVLPLLRKLPDLRDVPVIAITAHALKGDKERFIEKGATGYLEKPIKPDKIVKVIEEFL